MNTNKVQVKTTIDSDTKLKFAELAHQHGFDSIATVLRVYIENCVLQQSLNLDLTPRNVITNPQVIEAIEQAEAGAITRRELPSV
ncbi:MAG: antitoxin component of RelBE/YafQ-DinJ toxin-antitoxin module [Alteromonadaceae bacterium]|jgi:antitoxin component of RelBE/YafQ-DinJ toxin-antitoxin module